MCSARFLCSLGEPVWLITRRKPACWIINFSSPLPYFFPPLHTFLMLFLLPFSTVLFAKLLHPSFSALWLTFPLMELTTSIAHWRLATPPVRLASHLGWVYRLPPGILSVKAGERDRGREETDPGEFEHCWIISTSLAFGEQWPSQKSKTRLPRDCLPARPSFGCLESCGSF